MITDSGVTLYNDGQYPKIRVTVRPGEEKVYDIDDRRSTAKKVNKIFQKDESDDQDAEVLETVLGKKAAKEILESDISNKDFTHLIKQIMAIIAGESIETLEANAKN